jgi:xylulose-5-phosphate/fructose-6-phosphate phosphoketolase
MKPLDAAKLRAYRRAADYLSLAQIYLQANFFLTEPLRHEHIKDRLLGHWGTVPGINLVYAHLNRLILESDASVLLVTGPGHGAPANLSNLFLEGSLAERYPELTRDAKGAARLIRSFSWPGGFPSHLTPATPGVIHEGGELGYALAKAFGAAFDHPELIVACIVGDGESETGPTATAWHSTKFLDPVTSGAVLPILHVNGYKISSSTIPGAMSDEELILLFRGYGYNPRIVSAPSSGAANDESREDLDTPLAQAMDGAYESIRAIQSSARMGRREPRPAWPMIILRSPKGMGAPKQFHGAHIEGSWRAHQVPIAAPKTDPEALRAVEAWLRSYEPDTLFDATGELSERLRAQCPSDDRRMGMNPYANGGAILRPLDLPAAAAYETRLERGVTYASAMAPAGDYLRDTMRRSEKMRNFRIVCPDEMTSNRLGAVFDATDRAFVWPRGAEDAHTSPSGRVLEMLSEHQCQGWLEGYVLTGGHGLFPCYEAFIPIVDGMMNQYAKFTKQAREVAWRAPVASLNYLLTSDGWRQDHNGYSHQGPGFINAVLDKKAEVLRIYLPPDANTLLVMLEHCLRSRNYINLVIATKNPMPQWLTLVEAVEHARRGASVWEWAGNEETGGEPDVVLAACGTTPTLETVAAAALLRRDAPELRVRVVNVMDLLVLDAPHYHPHGMPREPFEAMFTRDRPVVFAFHGYPSAVEQLLFSRPGAQRFTIEGYREEGTTTTPFDMTIRNGISRFQLAIAALKRSRQDYGALVARYEEDLALHRRFIEENGRDPEPIANWRWP